jgi:UDP-glucose 4-epimerase
MRVMEEIKEKLSGKEILITGGLGMIGSTIAKKLVKYNTKVTIVDSCIEPYGANLFNIKDIQEQVRINYADIRDKESMKVLVLDKDIIFNLAGQVSHNDSIENPFLDADINYIGHLNVLESIRKYNPEAIVLHAGSRLQFGKTDYCPVDELHSLRPRTPYALNKTAAENSYLFYFEVYGIRSVMFRIANPYGPRSQMKHAKYSMINWFIRQALEGNTISIFGDGNQIRDYIYVDDLAEAFILASVKDDCYGEIFNVGCGVGTKFKDMVTTIVDVVGNGKFSYVPWPDNYINVETGDYVTNITKLKTVTGWDAKTDFADGINKTFDYYSRFRKNYW